MPDSAFTIRCHKDSKARGERWGVEWLTHAADFDHPNRNTFRKRVYPKQGGWNGCRVSKPELVLPPTVFVAPRCDYELPATMRDLLEVGVQHRDLTCRGATRPASLSAALRAQ